jgi:hypothetical protein
MAEPDKVEVISRRTAINLRWAARIIGLIILALFLSILVGETIASWTEEGLSFSVESLYIIVPAVLLLAFYLLAWWKERLGGILLVAGYLLLSFSPAVHSIFYNMEGFTFFIGMFFFAAPFLISGVLFILASVLSQNVK